jgi:hypothetical protein
VASLETLDPIAPRSDEDLLGLVYELLDAHDDTARLSGELVDERWEVHLDYLRDLQRVARESLARATRRELSLGPSDSSGAQAFERTPSGPSISTAPGERRSGW